MGGPSKAYRTWMRLRGKRREAHGQRHEQEKVGEDTKKVLKE